MLVPCTHIWGGADISQDHLGLDEVSNVVYIPQSPTISYDVDLDWGIYSYRLGDLIDMAALRRGVARDLVGQSTVSRVNHSEVSASIDETYIYGGVFNPHYGHFICTTLSRLWYAIESGRPDAKVLLHSRCDVDTMLCYPFVKACFERMGLSRDNLVVFDSPRRIKKLIIPAPAFQEQMVAHQKFRDLCLFIGKPFISQGQEHYPPAYLSKSRLVEGVGHFTNEADLEKTLKDEGFDVIYPEQLTFEKQVCLFSQHRVLAGTAGSAFHTSIFAPFNARIVVLVGYNLVNSNFSLIDRLTGADVEYLYPNSPTHLEYGVGKFLTSMTLDDPVSTGRDLAHRISGLSNIARPSEDSLAGSNASSDKT